MRIYVAADRGVVEALSSGSRVTRSGITAASDDELDEDDALYEAAESSSCVVVADLDSPDDGFTLDDVAAFHVDVDGTGNLAWYAPQEVADVLAALPATS